MLTIGGTKATVRLDDVVLLAMSVACTVIGLMPSSSGTKQVKVEFERDDGISLQVTLATPESRSLTAPVVVMSETLNVAPSTGNVISRLEGVLSRVTATLVVASFPA